MSSWALWLKLISAEKTPNPLGLLEGTADGNVMGPPVLAIPPFRRGLEI